MSVPRRPRWQVSKTVAFNLRPTQGVDQLFLRHARPAHNPNLPSPLVELAAVPILVRGRPALPATPTASARARGSLDLRAAVAVLPSGVERAVVFLRPPRLVSAACHVAPPWRLVHVGLVRFPDPHPRGEQPPVGYYSSSTPKCRCWNDNGLGRQNPLFPSTTAVGRCPIHRAPIDSHGLRLKRCPATVPRQD